MNKLLYLLFIISCLSCQHNSETEKYCIKSNNSINIKEKIQALEIDKVLLSRNTRPYLFHNYLIIVDVNSYDKYIHVFNKNTFDYITSFADKGPGPGEITIIGSLGFDKKNGHLYVNDHGKQKIFSYELDSVLNNPNYLPKEKLTMTDTQFPSRYKYINDTLCIGLIIEPIGVSDFNQSIGKWNISTGKIELMKYKHPTIEKKRINFAVSLEHNLYVEVYSNHDLMTICDLDGNLKYNIYGSRKWNSGNTNRIRYYGTVEICNNKIVVLYSGENRISENDDLIYPTKLLVFDIDGNYIKTLETEYQITVFSYDKENNRLILVLDDDIQFAYLDLNGIL